MDNNKIKAIISKAGDIKKLQVFAGDVARKSCHIYEQAIGDKGVDFCAIVAECEHISSCRAAAVHLVRLNKQFESTGNPLQAIRSVIFAALVGSYECIDIAKHNAYMAVIHALEAAQECKKTRNRIINCIDRFDRNWKSYKGSK